MSPLSKIITGIETTLRTWCADLTPVKGEVGIAADILDAYQLLSTQPKGFRIILWWAGGTPQAGDKTVDRLGVGIAVSKGMTKDPHQELLTGTSARAVPVLDIIEGIENICRSLYIGDSAPNTNADGCFLLTSLGGEWVKFDVDVQHYVHQLNFQLSRQMAERRPLAVTLT